MAGEVRTLTDEPLDGVRVRIDGQAAYTDETGRFLLTSIPPGHHVLLIDGRPANRSGQAFGVFVVGVDALPERTNTLPQPVWMPAIDTGHALAIPSPTTEEVVVTTPHIPGLELRIPPGTVIRDRDGEVVTQISITPVPVDRPPFPLPRGVDVPIFYTVQPGGAYLSPAGARLIYPNFTNEPPGKRIHFWNYDPEQRGWYVYGQGTVTPDKRQVIPDPSVLFYEFTGAMINDPDRPDPPQEGPPPKEDGGGGGPRPSPDPSGGEPVDLSTGLFVLEDTDLFLADILPLALTRTYRPEDSASRPFGIGTTHPYDMFLHSAQQYEEADLILPHGGRVHYVRISPGVGFEDAEFEHSTTPSLFHKSRIRWNGNGWDLELKNGTTYIFGDIAPLNAIRDRFGSKLTISRAQVNQFSSPTGNITQIRSPNGRWIELTYDDDDRITQASDNIGRVVTYTYDTDGKLSTVRDPNGGLTQYTYDSSQRIATIVHGGATVLTNEYDANGRVVEQTQADGSKYQFAYTIDVSDRITQTLVTDPRGNIRRVTFNPSGYIITDTRALGTAEEQTTSFERQMGTNLVVSVVDSLGRKTAYAYDAIGNLTAKTRLAGTPGAATVFFEYEARFNQVTNFTDPLGHAIAFDYDDKGKMIAATDPLGNRVTFAYNAVGQLISITDPLGQVGQFTYDAGHPVTVTDPLGRTTGRFFDSAGRLASVTTPLGHTTQYAHDTLDHLVGVVEPSGGVLNFAYDANHNLMSIVDARGSTTTYARDEFNRVATRTDPLLRTETYQYDTGGNVIQYTDRKDQITRFEYDSLNRLTRVIYDDGSTTDFQFDKGDRVTQVIDSLSGTILYAYDELDRVTAETTPQGSVNYTYDAADRLTSMTLEGQPTVLYSYDDANRLVQIERAALSVGIDYDAAGRQTSLFLPNDVSVSYGYDAASRLASIVYQRGTVALGDLTYEYDADGNRTKVGGSFANGHLPGRADALTYNAANQLVQLGETSLIHDGNGNLLSDGVRSYTWDVRNQLAAIAGPGISASFLYDAFGRRIRRVVNAVSVEFVYDDLNPVQELRDGATVTNQLTGLGIDEYFARIDGFGTVHTMLVDALGSTVALVDSAGSLHVEYGYEPFGKVTVTGAPDANSLQFAGRENDRTGLYHYRTRYYDPALHRFISEDPIGVAGGDVNLYAYALNSPTNFTDALGLCQESGEDIKRATERLREGLGEMYIEVVGLAGVGVGYGIRGVTYPISPWELVREPFIEGGGRYIPRALRRKVIARAHRIAHALNIDVNCVLDIAHDNPFVFSLPGAANRVYAQCRGWNRSDGSDIARQAGNRRANPHFGLPVRPKRKK
jgi:RHS repeat-associated protein